MSMECFSIGLCPLLFPWAVVCSSPWKYLSHPLLVVFLGILFSLEQPWVGVCSWFGLPFVCYWCIGMPVISVHWFCILRLLKLFISLKRFWAETMGSSKYIVMSSANKDNVTFSFPIWIHSVPFSCLITLTRPSNTMLNRNGERGHPLLVLVFKRNASRFAHSVWYWLWVCHKWLLSFYDMSHQYLFIESF